MCLGPAMVPPTEKARVYAKTFRVMLALQALVVVLNFIAAAAFLREAIFGIFFFFLLYIIQHQLSYQVIMVFIFISLFFAVNFMVYFLTPLQNQVSFPNYSPMQKYYYADAVFSFAYYTFCAVFCFYPYREFKTIEYNNNPALRNYFARGDHPDTQQNAPEKNLNAKTVNYEVNYG